MRRFVCSFALLLCTSSASAQVDCPAAEILQNNVTTYDSSIVTWLSFVDTVAQSLQKQKSSAMGFKYQGVSLNLDDAQALSSFYKSQTGFQVSRSERVSVLSSYLPRERLEAYVACLNARDSNVTISVPEGAEMQSAFQGVIKWHPNYPPQVRDGKVERPIRLAATNGRVVLGDGTLIEPQKDAIFSIERSDLDKPFYLTVIIDEKSSNILSFPARPKYTLAVDLHKAESGLLIKSGHYGPEAGKLSPPTCVQTKKGGILLPSSATITKVGAGREYDQRTKVEISTATPSEVCIVVSSVGVGCIEEKCRHQVQGFLSVNEFYLKEIKY